MLRPCSFSLLALTIPASQLSFQPNVERIGVRLRLFGDHVLWEMGGGHPSGEFSGNELNKHHFQDLGHLQTNEAYCRCVVKCHSADNLVVACF